MKKIRKTKNERAIIPVLGYITRINLSEPIQSRVLKKPVKEMPRLGHRILNLPEEDDGNPMESKSQ
jgi:hypothetical protein